MSDDALDQEVAWAVRRAAQGLMTVGKELREALRAGFTADLIKILRSGRKFSSAELDYIADLLAGELARQPGRPKRVFSDKEKNREMHQIYTSKMRARPRPRRVEVAQQVAVQFNVSVEQVLRVIKDRRMLM